MAAGYVRVSDPRQGTGSEETQAGLIRRFTESEGLVLSHIEADEESGLLETRPGYQRLLQGAREGAFQVVVVPRFDRFGRDEAEYFPRLREFSKLGVDVLSASETNGNAFVRGVLVLMANEESRRIATRVVPSKVRLAKNGYWNGKAVLGYAVARLMPDRTLVLSSTATQEQKRASVGAVLVKNDHAPLISESFRLYADGKATLLGVVDYLRTHGIQITRSGARYVLGNRVYLGLIRYGDHADSDLIPAGEPFEAPGKHPPLVDKETFERVQDRLERNRSMKSAANSPSRLLSGLLFCAECGARWTLSPSKTKGRVYFYYRCRGKTADVAAPRRCSSRYVRAATAEEQVKCLLLEALRPLGVEDAKVKARGLLEEDAATRKRDGTIERESLERRIGALERRLTKAEDAFFDGLLGRERYLERRDDITRELDVVQKQIGALPQVKAVNTTAVLRELDALEWDALSDEAWRHVLELLTDGVTYDWHAGEAVVRWKPEYRAVLGADK